jgi:carbon-monoxide dehydrogenase medium subunit
MKFSGNVAYAKEREWEQYLMPRTVEEALAFLRQHRGKARIIAGGTDLVVQARDGTRTEKLLVDITRIKDLDYIKKDKETVRIGCLATHARVAASAIIAQKGTALAEGASRLGSPQIRNVATVAGNIVNAQPGADTVIPLVALDAQVRVAASRGDRWIPLAKLFTGVGQCRIDSTREMLTEIAFAAHKKGEGSAAFRLAKRGALVLPILTVAAFVAIDRKAGRFVGARIAAGPVALTPLRCIAAERLLAGATISEDTIKKAAKDAAAAANPRTSLIRGTREYRQAMVEVLVERALKTALQRAEGRNG